VHEPGGYLAFAAGIKRRITIPVIAVGRIEPEVADKVIATGEADFIAMGRKLLADPELPNKLGQGRAGDVRPCIYCYVCVSQIFLNKHVICAVNAQTGHELDTLIQPTPNPRSVLIVGGGPGGMETARVAALRGHRVSLYEASSRLGGTVFFSSIAYPPNLKLIQYLERQVRELPIEIQLNRRLLAEDIVAFGADVVVVATGALRDAPPIPGADQSHVYSGDELRKLMTGEDPQVGRNKLDWFDRLMMFFGGLFGITRSTRLIRALGHLWMPVGKKVAVVGGGLVGVELAEFLAERGRQVTVIEEGEKFGVELSVVRRWRVLDDLRELGVVMINKARVGRIDKTSLQLVMEDGDVDIDADTVILASGAQRNLSLVDELTEKVETHVVGDCGGVGYIEGAMHSGNRVGRSI
jgi:NADPH-dependent 2,4-dienoyl-CoA reductase/sulfur reductase-like enzyme